MIYFFPIYHKGDKGSIDIGHDFPWEKDDYSVASHREFTEEKDAIDYCVELAQKHNKDYVGPNHDGTTHDYPD